MRISRRLMIGALGATLVQTSLPLANAAAVDHIKKAIPSTKEKIPVIGMGTWQTFNVGGDPELLKARTKVLKTFLELGGGMVDSSPMYGSAQDTLGWALKNLGSTGPLFAADKIWTRDGDETRTQLAVIEQRWGIKRFDLMQVHNLLAWREHLKTLQTLKAEGKIRYVGITTSHGRRHDDLERIMKTSTLCSSRII